MNKIKNVCGKFFKQSDAIFLAGHAQLKYLRVDNFSTAR